MAPAPRQPPKVPPRLLAAGVLVMAVGFGLPRLMTTSPAPAKPEPTAAAAPALPPDGPGLGASLVRLAVCLAVVCGLCVGAARLVAKPPPAPPKGMAVTAALPIDPRCTVYLVTAGDRRLLVGTDPAGVKAVVELPGPPPEAATPEPAAAAAEPVVVGPVKVPAPALAPTLRDDIAQLLDKLRHQSTAARAEQEV